jgi:hypothetical protein
MALSASIAPPVASQCNARRSVGSKIGVVDQVEEALDQVVGLTLLGSCECHIIMTD